MFTWSRDNSCSRLDRVYVSSHIGNRLIYSSVMRCPYSDHDAYCTAIMTTKLKQQSAYWHLNVSLLNDHIYVKLITHFWIKWQMLRDNYDDIRLWWDIGKVKIKELTQQYSIGLRSNILQNKAYLEEKIKHYEQELILNKSKIVFENLKQCRIELESMVKEEGQGALIRSRFNILNKIDKGTSFFFDLEKKNGKSKQMTHVILENGHVVDDVVGISRCVREYYSELFSPASVMKEEQSKIVYGLKQLSEEDKKMCDVGLNFNEITVAMTSLSINKSPGMDGLPVNFYSKFWDVLGRDLYDVILFSIEEGELPLSHRRAVLTLLPKDGNNGFIKNWRPISLLCADYKIFAKALSNRLSKVLASIIHETQSYAICKRKIYNNIHMIRDSIAYANLVNCPLAVLSLDQEKAFDRINHEYLFSALRGFGFSSYFISCIQIMYKNAQALVKINSKLLSPIKFGSGIKQGDPISAALYCLALEPLLVYLRSRMTSSSLNVHGDLFITSAYADDLCVLCTNNEGFDIIKEALRIYEKASSAKVNYSKSVGLWSGSWKERDDLPLGLKWTKDGFKYLGIFLGNTESFEKKNFVSIKSDIEIVLKKWKFLAPILSYRGRVLIINNLCASKLWHKVMCSLIEDSLIKEI